MNTVHLYTLSVVLLLLASFIEHIKVCCAGSIQWDQNSEEINQNWHSASETFPDNFNISKDQTLVVRLPSNSLLKYTAYKDVSILHFRVPSDTRSALFTFKAFEESKSAFLERKCKPRDITLSVKARSYPVISPENITFPRNFLNPEQRFKIYNIQFKSDKQKQQLTVKGPQIGNWFAVAFVSWTDPNNDRIEQQGLAASCDTLLLAEMSVTRFLPTLLNSGQIYNGTLTAINNEQHIFIKDNFIKKNDNSNIKEKNNSNTHQPAFSSSTLTNAKLKRTSQEQTLKIPNLFKSGNSSTDSADIFKFFVPNNIGTAIAEITIVKACLACPNVGFFVQANAYPCTEEQECDDSDYIHRTLISSNQEGKISIEFYVQPNMWHYTVLKFTITSEERAETEKSPPSAQKKTQQLEHEQLVVKTAETDSTKWQYTLSIGFQTTEEDEGNGENKLKNSATETTSIKNNTEKNNSWSPVPFRNIEFYTLLRQTYREFFMFDYDLMPDSNGTIPTVLNLTAGMPAGFSFEVGDVYDIGGTLSFAISMKHGSKASSELRTASALNTVTERSGILAEKLVRDPDISAAAPSPNIKNSLLQPRSNQTIIVCMHLGEPGEPTWPDKCRYGQKLLPASSIVNNTDSNTSTGLIHVPFPESGQWYVTMGLYCHGAETAARITIIDSVKEYIKKYANKFAHMKQPCACANSFDKYQACIQDSSCLTNMTEAETLKMKECLMDSKCISNYVEMTRRFEIHQKLATEQPLALDNCNTSVVFTISSSPCVAGRCGRFGRCYHYMSGGFVFSTCVCIKGYRGWDCSEDSQVPSSISILLASLLLTLSNLLFIPSIYMAVSRKYYTEAVIYFFVMFFSIFYHACDSGEDEYSFCLVKIAVLQFCDFYCGLLSIWVTLVSMSHIHPQFVSLLHMLGAILLAFGTELNKQSLWVFLAPALTGICLISVSWGLRCYKSQKWFPARKYRTVYMPLGTVFVMVGLVCFAFLQTKQNYHIVHSIWHMVMALSILCLLPSHKSFIPKC